MTMYVILEKSRVKGFIRTRKGKMERVNPFERKGEKKKPWETEYDYVETFPGKEEVGKIKNVDELQDRAKSLGWVYRGVSNREAKQSVKLGHPLESKSKDLIGGDWEVLEYAFEELRNMSHKKAEKFLKKVVPKWAVGEGVNATTDFDNVLGYAQPSGGKVLVIDPGESEVFEPSSSHTQIRSPKKAKVKAVIDNKGQKILWLSKELK